MDARCTSGSPAASRRGQQRPRSASAASLVAAGALGVLSVFAVHAAGRAPDAADPPDTEDTPPCPVSVNSRYRDLGTRWVHEIVATTFLVTNDAQRPVQLYCRTSRCDGHHPFAVTDDGARVELGERAPLALRPNGQCAVGVRFAVRGAATGARTRLVLDCTAVDGVRSWPLVFTIDYRAEPAVLVTPRAARVGPDAGMRLATVQIALADGTRFAAGVRHDPQSPVWTFATPASPSGARWTLAVLAGRGPATEEQGRHHGRHVVPVDVVTPGGRWLQVAVPLSVAN